MSSDSPGTLPAQHLTVEFDESRQRFAAIVVSRPELRGEGATWAEAVDALWSAVSHPPILQRLRDGSGSSGRFSVRVPSSVHQALDAMAQSEGVSLNMLVASILAEKVGRGTAQAKALSEETLISLLPGSRATTSDDVGTALRVIHNVMDEMSLASVALALAILCGDRVKQLDDPTRTADHYGKFAFRAMNEGFTTLALAMWEESLRVKPKDNPKSSSSYGCVLYQLGKYEQAERYLATVSDREGKLTYHKAVLRLAIAESSDDTRRHAAIDAIREAMRMWAYGATQREARRWNEHMKDLADIDSADVRALITELREYAVKHSRWR